MTAITQLQPGAWSGKRYGSFSGRISAKPILTQLQPGAWGGKRYAINAFAGRTPAVTGSYRFIGRFSGKAIARGFLTHLVPRPFSNSASAAATSESPTGDIYISKHF